jgi:hypothetical protein
MAWSMPTWKILQIYQIQFLFGEVRDETRHSLYTKTLCTAMKIVLNFEIGVEKLAAQTTQFFCRNKSQCSKKSN